MGIGQYLLTFTGAREKSYAEGHLVQFDPNVYNVMIPYSQQKK